MNVCNVSHPFSTVFFAYLLFPDFFLFCSDWFVRLPALTKRKRPTADDDDLGEDLSGPWAEDKAESEAKQAKLASAAAAAAKEESLPVEESYEETEYAANVHMQEPDEEAEKW